MKFKEKFEISIRCPICGKYHSVFVEKEDYHKWLEGNSHVQDVFPYLKAEDREILISGVCPKCWNNIFPEEEEEQEIA